MLEADTTVEFREPLCYRYSIYAHFISSLLKPGRMLLHVWFVLPKVSEQANEQ